jgi:hypothetical protein
MQMIEYVIYNTPNVGVVFIDGIRDLVTSINDEEQATIIASKLMQWTQELNIHISCTLHMNKGDNNARGHLGTELLNKSLVTIAVSKCGPLGMYSKVVVTNSREKEPPPFMFGVNSDGLPYIMSESSSSYKERAKYEKSKSPENYENEEHMEKLSHIFSKSDELSYMQLVEAVKQEYRIGVNKSKEFVKYLLNEKLIKGEKNGKRTVYSSDVV